MFARDPTAFGGRALTRLLLGDTARARVDALKAREIGEQTHDSVTIAWAEQSLGRAHLLDGNWAEAVETLERALSLIRRDRILVMEDNTLCWLARAYLGRGEGKKARELADEALRR